MKPQLFNKLLLVVGMFMSVNITAEAQLNLNKIANAAKNGAKQTTSNVTTTNRNPAVNNVKPTNTSALYVCKATGSNRNDGSKDAPFKNLQKALDVAFDGQTIYVAEGVYMGNLDNGTIELKNKGVKIYGGYSSDFSKRDISGTPTLIQPDLKCKGTRNATNYAFGITADQPVQSEVLIDGLIFNNGNHCTYLTDAMQERKGKRPAGIESNCLAPSPRPYSGVGGPNLDTPTQASDIYELRIYSNSNGHFNGGVTIQNCVFTNADCFAIQGQIKGNLLVQNNVFCNVAYSACAVAGGFPPTQYGQKADGPRSRIEFAYNTVLFIWARDVTPDSDMGWGYRYMNGADHFVHNNIFGCTASGALDRSFVEHNKADQERQQATCDDNIFFCNRKADLVLPSSGTLLPVWAKDLEDVETLTGKVSGNKTIDDASAFKGRIDDAYMKAYLNANYSESTNYNPNSAANVLRSAFGMNQTGTMTIKVNFFGNRYPLAKVYDLFGAMEGYGAQNL